MVSKVQILTDVVCTNALGKDNNPSSPTPYCMI